MQRRGRFAEAFADPNWRPWRGGIAALVVEGTGPPRGDAGGQGSASRARQYIRSWTARRSAGARRSRRSHSSASDRASQSLRSFRGSGASGHGGEPVSIIRSPDGNVLIVSGMMTIQDLDLVARSISPMAAGPAGRVFVLRTGRRGTRPMQRRCSRLAGAMSRSSRPSRAPLADHLGAGDDLRRCRALPAAGPRAQGKRRTSRQWR